MATITQPILEGKAPALTPTARPLSISVGATPPPSRSPLMELGQSLEGWYPLLSDKLKETVAIQERDAATAGELAMRKEGAQAILDKTESQLKDLADSYQIPHVRLPAFQRSLNLNTGAELAQTQLQSSLLARLNEATAVTGDDSATHDDRINKIVQEEFSKTSSKIHGSNVYAQQGFLHASDGIIAQFQQRAREGYAANYQRVGETKLAQSASDIVTQLAHANVDDTPTLLTALKSKFDEVRSVYPKHDANTFVVENSILPVVNDLITQHKPTEARQVLNAVRGLDLTGQGGVLGKVTAVAPAFDQMERAVETEERQAPHIELERLVASRELAKEKADSLFIDKLKEWKDAGAWTKDKTALEASIRSVEGSFPDTHEGRATAKAFRDAATAQYNHDTSSSVDRTAEAEFETQLQTYDPAKLEALTANLANLKAGWKVSPERWVEFSQALERNKQLYGVVNAREVGLFQGQTFLAVPNTKQLGEPEYTLNLGSAGTNANVASLWNGKAEVKATKKEPASPAVPALSLENKESFQNQLNQTYRQNLIDEIRKVGDPNKVSTDMEAIRARATEKSQRDGVLLLQALHDKQAEAQTAYLKRAQDEQAARARAEQRALSAIAPVSSSIPDEAWLKYSAGQYGGALKGGDVPYETPLPPVKASTWEANSTDNQRRRDYVEYVWRSVTRPFTQPVFVNDPQVNDISILNHQLAAFKDDKSNPRFQELFAKRNALIDAVRKRTGTTEEAPTAQVPSERDITRFPGKPLLLDLGATGQALLTVKDPELSRQLKDAYAVAKSQLGFTPEEITAGVTRHGVKFDASEVDPKRVPLFRTKAELAQHWNEGQPSPLFIQVGDAVDPQDRLTARQLFDAQNAILSRKGY